MFDVSIVKTDNSSFMLQSNFYIEKYFISIAVLVEGQCHCVLRLRRSGVSPSRKLSESGEGSYD